MYVDDTKLQQKSLMEPNGTSLWGRKSLYARAPEASCSQRRCQSTAAGKVSVNVVPVIPPYSQIDCARMSYQRLTRAKSAASPRRRCRLPGEWGHFRAGFAMRMGPT